MLLYGFNTNSRKVQKTKSVSFEIYAKLSASGVNQNNKHPMGCEAQLA